MSAVLGSQRNTPQHFTIFRSHDARASTAIRHIPIQDAKAPPETSGQLRGKERLSLLADTFEIVVWEAGASQNRSTRYDIILDTRENSPEVVNCWSESVHAKTLRYPDASAEPNDQAIHFSVSQDS